jgi:hypothetical protein
MIRPTGKVAAVEFADADSHFVLGMSSHMRAPEDRTEEAEVIPQ